MGASFERHRASGTSAPANLLWGLKGRGNDPEGTDELGNFIDPEAKYPVIVTTSRLLSTGVDAQTCRLIVLDREVGSMTELCRSDANERRVTDVLQVPPSF